MINLWPLLLPASAWSGWWIARKQSEQPSKHSNETFSREYVVGLNYLLNEQPDKAVDLFIKLLEVDSETVETHLALGSLFRRRGEVDRAIRIHQNLIARPQLSENLRKDALAALAQDYMSAGVFDRAEGIHLELVELGGEKKVSSLRGLLAIYQQEKAWEKALEVLALLEKASGASLRSQAAHYHCEMAQEALKKNAYDKASVAIRHALAMDSESVRASLMSAHLEIKNGRQRQAIRILKCVPLQDPEFLSEIVEPLLQCYEGTDNIRACIDYFEQMLEDYPRISVIFAIGNYLKDHKDRDQAIDFVAEQLNRHPSIRGLNKLIYWHLESAQGKVRNKLQILYDITHKLLENKPIYRCGHCGYSGKILHWLCPSCKYWGSVKPIHGLEGD